MRRQDDELVRIASNALVHRPGDRQNAFAVPQAAFAQYVDEGVGGRVSACSIASLISLAATSFRATRSSRKPTLESIWVPLTRVSSAEDPGQDEPLDGAFGVSGGSIYLAAPR
jgi:hypothetical protein